jgi:hypothetical protein
MTPHELAWTAPQPFWTDPSGRVVPHGDLVRPQILRFATDDFMPELLSLLEQDPASLAKHAVYKETWRGPAGAPAADAQRWLQREPKLLLGVKRAALKRARAAGLPAASLPRDTAPQLKLYQPAHLRHYLVSGSLVCRTAGLPDRQVDPARHKVSFVVRRLFPRTPVPLQDDLPDVADTALWDEHAFVLQGKAGAWRKVGPAGDEAAVAVLLPGEERLAMFPSAFVQDDGHPRRLYVGSVPVGRRETYQGAGPAPAAGGPPDAGPDPRMVLFHTQVLAPWKAVVNRVMRLTTGTDPVAARPDFLFEEDGDGHLGSRSVLTDKGRRGLQAARGALQTASWYLLLDLHAFLRDRIGQAFVDALASGTRPAGAAGELFDALGHAAWPTELTSGGSALTEAAVGPSLVDPNTAYDAAPAAPSRCRRPVSRGPPAGPTSCSPLPTPGSVCCSRPSRPASTRPRTTTSPRRCRRESMRWPGGCRPPCPRWTRPSRCPNRR